MKNKSMHGLPPASSRVEFPCAPAVAVLAMATAMTCAGCSSKVDTGASTPLVAGSNVTLTRLSDRTFGFIGSNPQDFAK